MKISGFAASSANTTATGELGSLFLPTATGYRPDIYTSLGFDRARFATYDESLNDLNPNVNQVIITPPAFALPCRAATTANISLSGLQTIDGIALIAGDRVLVKNQSTATQNGIYTVASGSWARPFDSDTGAELVNSKLFSLITLGTVNGGYYAVIQNIGTITLGTTAIIYDMILDPVLLESQTVYWLRFKDFPTGARWYATATDYSAVYAKLATTANITLSGNQTIDGVLTVNGDKVIVKNQTISADNGYYVASSGAWSLYPDLISYTHPWLFYVSSGTVNAGRTFSYVRTVDYILLVVYIDFTLVSMKLYPTLADATAETNALISSYRTAFGIVWITKPYTPIACVEMAAADVADIYCCPEPTPLLQTFPDHVEIVLEADPQFSGVAGETVLLTMFADSVDVYVGSGPSISTYNSAEYTPLIGTQFWFSEYSYPICGGTPKKTTIRYISWNNNNGLDYTQNVIYRYQTGTGADLCDVYPSSYWQGWRYSPTSFYHALPTGYEIDFGQHMTLSTSPNHRRILSVEVQSAQTIPPEITCYLVDAVFQRTTVDIPSGDDIAIGTISVTLTYDAASSTYFGPVANYYNIPGRLSMPIGILPTVASGNQFLEVTNPNWKVNSSNQIYYEKYLSAGAPSNTITLSYSSYSDARKPQAATLNFYKTNVFSVYTETNGSLMRSDPTTQTATP